jgi:hypothetical protein
MTAAASNPKRSVKEYRCNLCGRIFDSSETLDSHKRMDHGQEGKSDTRRNRLVVYGTRSLA